MVVVVVAVAVAVAVAVGVVVVVVVVVVYIRGPIDCGAEGTLTTKDFVSVCRRKARAKSV